MSVCPRGVVCCTRSEEPNSSVAREGKKWKISLSSGSSCSQWRKRADSRTSPWETRLHFDFAVNDDMRWIRSCLLTSLLMDTLGQGTIQVVSVSRVRTAEKVLSRTKFSVTFQNEIELSLLCRLYRSYSYWRGDTPPPSSSQREHQWGFDRQAASARPQWSWPPWPSWPRPPWPPWGSWWHWTTPSGRRRSRQSWHRLRDLAGGHRWVVTYVEDDCSNCPAQARYFWSHYAGCSVSW